MRLMNMAWRDFEMKQAATQSNDNSFSLRTEKNINIKLPKQKVKEKALEAFLRSGRDGFYQILAYNTFQVTCLHTYISNFEKQGVLFDRERITHINAGGGNTSFTRYWLADQDAYDKALYMVNFLRSQRGLDPLNDIPPYTILNPAA
jgi:type IV secretory pathway VirB9-like protein